MALNQDMLRSALTNPIEVDIRDLVGNKGEALLCQIRRKIPKYVVEELEQNRLKATISPNDKWLIEPFED